MAGTVQNRIVGKDDAEMRLDRWFKRHFPTLTHGRLEKLLRTGQVRLNGKRAQGSDRVASGDSIRVPPLPPVDEREALPRTRLSVNERDARELQKLVIYRDAEMLAIDKPAGLAVQGGTGTSRHLDGMLHALLLLARTRKSATRLTSLFRTRDMRKIYWAVVVGRPKVDEGDIRLALAKRLGRPGEGEERMVVDEKDGEAARTLFRLLDAASKKVSLLELEPLTGRTHQLRVHCLALGTPILGDGKYGGKAAFVAAEKAQTQLHLLARELHVPKPGGGSVVIRAAIPPHMRETMEFFGLSAVE